MNFIRKSAWFTNNGTFRRGGKVSTLKRAVVALQIVVLTVWLHLLNLWSRRPVTGTSDVDVSLTTFGDRTRSVWLTLETIARGTTRPRRLILWLDDDSVVQNPPKRLRRLRIRGLEIKRCEDYGPHKKYYPYLLECQPLRTLVTADDDVYYPRSWLTELLRAHRKDEVTAYRARIRTEEPYALWPLCATKDASSRVFATGVSGVAYPPRLLAALRDRGDQFVTVCPRADDFWLHFAAVASDTPIRQVRSLPADWWPHLRLAGTGLWPGNLTGGENDAIVAGTKKVWRINALNDPSDNGSPPM